MPSSETLHTVVWLVQLFDIPFATLAKLATDVFNSLENKNYKFLSVSMCISLKSGLFCQYFNSNSELSNIYCNHPDIYLFF